LDSKNGTQINGRPIERAQVHPFDEVTFGGVTAIVHVFGEERVDGVVTHEQFSQLLRDEIVRTRAFSRPASLLMIRARRGGAGIGVFIPRLRSELREVDRIGAYARDIAEVLLVEASAEEAQRVAGQITATRGGNEVLLVAGVASFGGRIASGDELIANA